ncbi:cbb3-type cytochrome c oxidase subunit I [Thioclava sp. JM3]|uniref:cbb3-type cytochrome c oxidase subunit I n=1 Tax=Thioclava sp. JM3 TaxID=1973004 RepID=UPI001F0B2F84|nr:cbb3-type cytochrome c oxidase subunit I [Thioclava sp. JM3]
MMDWSTLYGRLDYGALPFYSPIAFAGAAVTVLAGVAVVAIVLWTRSLPMLWRDWLTSTDHKKLGIMYVVLALVLLLRGFVDALMMRAQQAFGLNDGGYLPPEHYDQIFSAHGTIMILFMAMPFLTGLMNFVVPLQIGARDVAFPRLNNISFWLTAAGAGLVLISLVLGKFSQAGWTGYPPLSEREFSPDTGVDYWIWALLVSGVGTTLTGINFIVTIVKRRAPGMTWMRLPMFTWTALCASILIVLAFPALTVAAALLGLDRNLGMHFFTNDGGGNPMQFANIIWMWGHPEVYILILPAFGVFSEVVATFSTKRLFGYASLVWATMVIAILAFTTWLHHFFTMGSGASVNAFFGITTMIIAVPTGVKIFDWILTMWGGRVRFEQPMLWTLAFLISFTIGGMTGVMLAVPAVDYVLHNSTFLVAHFHNMLVPGALFGFFAGYTYWFPKAFGFRLDDRWGRRAVFFWATGFWVAFTPLYWLGLKGMVRRMQSYDVPQWQPWLVLAAVGAVLVLCGIICQIIQLRVSIRDRVALRDPTGDPWNGRTLEWATPSPAPAWNFAHPPQVDGRDAFWRSKARGIAYADARPIEAIHLPRGTLWGIIIGGLAFALGFGVVWWMWWLAVAAVIGLVVAIILISLRPLEEVTVPQERIAAADARWRKEAASGSRWDGDPLSDHRHELAAEPAQ